MQPARVPRRLPRQARSRALVDAIVDAGAQILAREGRDALTTNRVATVAGCSVGSLYQYFPNRDSIIDAVADRHGARICAAMGVSAASTPSTLDEAVTRAVGGVFAAHRIDPELHFVIEGDLPQRGHAGTRAALRAQLDSLPPGERAGVCACDSDRAALLVSEIAHALAEAAYVRPTEGAAAEMLEREAVRASLAYLRAR